MPLVPWATEHLERTSPPASLALRQALEHWHDVSQVPVGPSFEIVGLRNSTKMVQWPQETWPPLFVSLIPGRPMPLCNWALWLLIL